MSLRVLGVIVATGVLGGELWDGPVQRKWFPLIYEKTGCKKVQLEKKTKTKTKTKKQLQIYLYPTIIYIIQRKLIDI